MAKDDRHSASGRFAENVFAIPLSGWRAILSRTMGEIGNDNLTLVAGGCAFFLLLAIFPALAAFVAIYGLYADPSTVEEHLSLLTGVMPASGAEIIGGELTRLASTSGGSLGLGLIAGVVLSLWSANAGVKALFAAMNVAYEEEEDRGFVRLTLVSLTFTVLAILAAAALVVAVIAVPAVLSFAGLPASQETLISLGRWPLLLLIVWLGLMALYRVGPSRRSARLAWLWPGALLTAIVWLIASALFSFYLANFSNYSATYGTLGALIGFLMWMYVSLLIVLVGAELNAETERQLATDTTVGPARGMGRRGAVVADNLP